MAKKTFSSVSITGTAQTVYDLDKLKEDSRTNADKALVVHVWKYNPNSSDVNKRSPRPNNLQTGQIWLAKKSEEV